MATRVVTLATDATELPHAVIADVAPSHRTARRLWTAAVAACAVAVAVAVGVVVLNAELVRAAPAVASGPWDVATSTLLYLFLVGLATVVIRRERRHPVGWLLLLLALLGGAESLFVQLALVGLHVPGGDLHRAAVYAAISESLQRPQFGVALGILAVFPTGHLPSRRWRPLGWLLVLVFSGWFAVHLLRPEPLEENPFAGLTNPLGLGWLGGDLVHYAFLPAAGALAVAVLVSMVVRFRRSRGDERQQLKWVAFLAAGVPLGLIALGLGQLWGPTAMFVAGNAIWVFMSVGLPSAVAVAIIRYRLYDLDLLVNRTIVYATVSVVLLATYATVVLLVSRVVVHTGWTSPWVVAAATVAAALVAAPARRVTQQTVDRLFGRRAWDAARQVQAYAAAWRDQPRGPDSVREMFAEALRDPSVVLGFWLRRAQRYVGIDGCPLAVPEPGSGRSPMYLDLHGEPVAMVVHDARLDRDRRLLRAVAGAGGLVTENARLHAEILEQLTEVEASRTRLVEAADAERRRVERDLHDGAQQRLVALTLRLRMAARVEGPGQTTLLEAVVAELSEATRELRELSRGIHPAALDHGLDAALDALGGRSPVPLDLDVPEHLPPQVELTTYYLACEALTNAIKHAGATRIAVQVKVVGREVVLQVQDDGCGGADPTRGSGLTGLTDRAAAAGGSVQIDSPTGVGTVIVARLPCGS